LHTIQPITITSNYCQANYNYNYSYTYFLTGIHKTFISVIAWALVHLLLEISIDIKTENS